MKEAFTEAARALLLVFSSVFSHSQIKPHTSIAHTLSQARSPF